MKLETLSTGVVKLDEAMGGGIPLQSVTIVAGAPGTGKTVLALQLMFAAARAGKKCLFFTTLSEPSLKLMRYMQLFEFFDRDLVDRSIVIHDLGSRLRGGDLDAVLQEVTDRVEEHEPDVVVIDSFKAIHEMTVDRARTRTFIYDLAIHITGWGATTVLVGEYDDADLLHCPEFAIADGIVTLGVARQELAVVRELEIRKLRGAHHVTGVQFFDIDSSGILFYPRVRGPKYSTARPALGAPMPSGVAAIDELFRGGIPEASATVVLGATGTGKTLIGLHFLVEGARRGEPCVLFTLEETADQLRAIGDAFGFDLTGLERQGLLRICYTAPVELSTDRFLNDVREVAARMKAKRAVLDSLTSLSLGAITERRYRELVYSLAKHFRDQEVTLMATLETSEMLGSAHLSAHGLSFAADNIIQLRYVEIARGIGRAVSVIKARGVDILTEARPFAIGARGMEVGPAEEAEGVRGVLTGISTGE
ncbi:MAG: AAA family ATPase [Deltaproteobacteria bacterium]|nr:AAA family ATPase [Deltaproteobacteria bacterium]